MTDEATPPAPPTRVVGVDFSGAMDAGKRIWIAQCRASDDGLAVESLQPAEELPYGGADRGDALYALVAHVMQASDAAYGLDFPFSLPRAVVPDAAWADFVAAFPGRYRDADEMREAANTATGGVATRATDDAAKAPYGPTHPHLYKQTYHGIGDVLSPLVTAGAAVALPMQAPAAGTPWLLEVCPASTLQDLGLYDAPYKRRSADARARREAILAALPEAAGAPVDVPREAAERAVRDHQGDALDALLCAAATHRHTRQPAGLAGKTPGDPIEGRIYH